MIGLDVPVSAECEPDKSNRHEDSASFDQLGRELINTAPDGPRYRLISGSAFDSHGLRLRASDTPGAAMPSKTCREVTLESLGM